DPGATPGTPDVAPGAPDTPPGEAPGMPPGPPDPNGAPPGPPDTAGGAPSPEPGTAPSTTAPQPVEGRPGAAGRGDSYLRQAGNGGYDVRHYDIDLRYRSGGRVTLRSVITATALHPLSRFNLDFRGPSLRGVAVQGRAAQYRRSGQELVITPAAPVRSGTTFTVEVRYDGKPRPVHNKSLGTYGWVASRDGAVVLAEPDGAPTWLPVNDHPTDKATYAYRITVPAKLRAFANGVPGRVVRRGGETTYEWAERSPMASYLATVAIGRFEVRKGKVGKVPVITAVDPKFRRSARKVHDLTVEALRWETKLFGRYPFASSGGIVDDPALDYALETQERPIYAGFVPDEDFVVHELAHQWFGNSVTLSDWSDIWLNEGFATYAEWLWAERSGPDSAKKIFDRYYRQPADSPIFSPPPGRPGHRDLFGFSVYVRGAMALQALRQKVGDARFFRILRTWASGRPHRNVTTRDFIAHAERVSGKKVGPLLNAWLYDKGKPRL
ncbi:M1 family metallopeptidase, partial [Actinomadura kijaniata]|uniref:M1 family metallopeptidase n=1 Tax=Actinomadura kijaniata TaxID=46161 RepID=UPI000A886003